MALKKEQHLYEILIRFGPDGFRGAHAVDLERVTESGEVVHERPGDPRPLKVAELSELVGARSARLIEAAETARNEAAAAREEAAANASRAEAAEAKAAALTAEVDGFAALEARLAKLESAGAAAPEA